MKEGKYTGTIKILNRQGNKNKNKMTKNNTENDREEEDDTKREPQLQKCRNLTSNTYVTNDSICNSCTSASRNNNNNKNNGGTETVINLETNSVTTNDEGSKGKVAEA